MVLGTVGSISPDATCALAGAVAGTPVRGPDGPYFQHRPLQASCFSECGEMSHARPPDHPKCEGSDNILTWPLQVKDLTRYLDPSGLGVISFEDFYRGITAIRNGGQSPHRVLLSPHSFLSPLPQPSAPRLVTLTPQTPFAELHSLLLLRAPETSQVSGGPLSHLVLWSSRPVLQNSLTQLLICNVRSLLPLSPEVFFVFVFVFLIYLVAPGLSCSSLAP